MIKTYFTDLDQIKEHLTVDVSSDLDTILPYIKQAEKYVIEIIGETLHDNLIAYLFADPFVENETLEKLLSKVRVVAANFGYFLAVPKLNINVGDTGFTVTSSSNFEPASQWRVDQFRASVEIAGYDAQEELIKFLEKNKNDYTDWALSPAYSFNKNLFINNSTEFFQTILFDIKRINFIKIKHFILQTENFEIRGAIGKALFDEIKSQILSGNISALNQTLLKDFIKPSVCYLACNKFNPDETFLLEGNRLIKELRNYLNSNAIDYPLYLNSDLYEETISEDYNSEDSGIYFFR